MYKHDNFNSTSHADEFKGSLGEGLLNWEVSTQGQDRPPMNLPPPTSSSDPAPDHAPESPMDQSDDAEKAESKSGMKRALSLSPQTESHGTGEDSGADSAVPVEKTGQGPEIKRRNVAIYGAEVSEETEEA